MIKVDYQGKRCKMPHQFKSKQLPNKAFTDECDCNWVWDKQLDFLWTAETTDLGQFYTGLVPAVTKATSLLERMRKISKSAPIKRRYMAEVRCLRAMWAYDLYDLYGTVP